MNGRVYSMRLPLVAGLALVLALLLARSSLARLLPFSVGGIVWAWLILGLFAALLPALFARDTPLPAAAVVTVPALAVASYGASRLDWLRVLKDFGVAETGAIDFARLALGALALVLLWMLHALDLSTRLKLRAIERGIEAPQATSAGARALTRSAQALGLALAGAAGLLVVALVGIQIGAVVPTERGAFVVPLVAAALLVGAAVYLARGEKIA